MNRVPVETSDYPTLWRIDSLNKWYSRAAFSGALIALTVGVAHARPPFAEKEGKPCSYCHQPGPPKRNYRGDFYKANNHTFAKFDDAAEAKKAGVDVGPDAEGNPKSWTAPDKAAEPEKKPEAPAETEKKGPTVAELKKKVAAAGAAAKKSPKDAKAKTAYAQALAELGHATMLDASVPPRLRYVEALKTLRLALKVDPKNAAAKEDVTMIEDVYKKMGKPIPK